MSIVLHFSQEPISTIWLDFESYRYEVPDEKTGGGDETCIDILIS